MIRNRLLIAIVLLSLTLPLTAGQSAPTLRASTGDLFLRADGTMTSASGGSPAPCITLSGAPNAPSTAAKTWRTSLTNGTYHVEEGTLLLSLAYADNPQAGSGFRLDASVKFGNLSAVTATKSYGQGVAVDSPATLPFSVPDTGNTSGPLEVVVTLTRTGAAAALQNIQIQCDHQDSKLHSFPYMRGGVGDQDVDADGVPDPTDPDVVAPQAPGEEGEEEHLRPLTAAQRWGVTGIAVLAGIVTLIAGLMVLAGKTITEKRAHLLLGGTAGLLLAVALVDLVPEALHEAENAGWTIALGLLALVSIRWITGEGGHAHGHAPREEPHEEHAHEEHRPEGHKGELGIGRLAAIAFIALLFHRIVDGLALPGAFAAGGVVGITAGAAILAHQFPDGLAAASIFVGSGWHRRRSLKSVGILSFATPVGAVIGLAFATVTGFLPHLLALAAATFIFIALSELLPELRKPEHRWTVATGFLIGYALTFLLGYIADLAGVQV